MSLFFQLGSIFILGFIGGAIPGPILTSAFTEVVHKGFTKSLRVIFFAAVSEIIVASFILFALFSVRIPQTVFYAVSFVGAVVLIWMASQIWRIKKLSDKGKLFDFKKIFLLTVFNGPLWIFWTTICVPQAYVLSRQVRGGQIVFLALFEVGWFTSTLLLTLLFSRFRPLLVREGVISKVFKFFSCILGLFAIKMVFEAVAFFIK